MRYYCIILTALIFLLSGCFEGYTGKDGQMLTKYIEKPALKALVENPVDDIWIVDVRPASAYEKEHIPTARSFPSSTIMDQLDSLPKDKHLILYCETGGRAQKVIKQLEKKGYTKFMNWGGFSRWN